MDNNLDWDLSPLYDSFDSEKFQSDLQKAKDVTAQLIKDVETDTLNHDNEAEKIKRYLDDITETSNYTYKLSAYTELTQSVDSNNADASKYQDILANIDAEFAAPMTRFAKWLAEVENLDAVIKANPELEEHRFFLNQIVKENKHLLSEKEEVLMAKLQTTGSNAWQTYKNKLIATHKVAIEVDGKVEELPLTVVLNMAYDKSKEVRKKAYEAEIASYVKIEEGVAAALNAIKGEVLTKTAARGYESPLHMTLENSNMQKSTLDAMLTAMKDNMQIFRDYLKAKAKFLGYNNGLPFYELYAPVTNKEMRYEYEDGKKFVVDMFNTFSKELGDFAQNAMDKCWIDVMPKEGKVGGAFCLNIPSIGESRFLLNYGNDIAAVITMAHELGHGYHGHCLKDESILNSDYPMQLAETASIFCETIVKKAAIKQSEPEVAFAVLEAELSDCTQVIVDIYSRFLFESKVFEKRKNGTLSVEEIKEAMIEAQKEAYGDGLDPEYLHPYMWTWKSHYYYPTANFYNFPYAFGQLFAKGLYAKYLEQPEGFPEKYKELLKATGKMETEDVTKTMNIDVTDPKFWNDAIGTIADDIKEFIKLCEKMK